ncbi:MAG TPA: ATP synthase subunit I [Candidatus Angelobacter sp.]|nr:ATP synthase subunit I [Candidatus Angelobacter sp.]
MTTPSDDNQQDVPELPVQAPIDSRMEERLSGAYQRILRVAIALSVIGSLAAALLFSWQSGLGLAVGALLAFVNFVWLHRSTEKLVSRMISAGKSPPRKLRFAFPFPLRYALMIAVAYVILKSYPGLLVGFLVGLILPIIASMGEGIYEALVIGRIDQT